MKFYRNKLIEGHWKMIKIELTDKEFEDLIYRKNLKEVRPGHFVNDEETLYLEKIGA